MDRETLQTNGVGSLFPSGVGYVAIPGNIDRTIFVNNCLKTRTVFIRGESGESFQRVKIDKSKLQQIQFPVDSKSRGSIVVWVKIPKHNIPVVIGVIDANDVMPEIDSERQMRFLRKNIDGDLVDISGKADDITLNVNAISTKNGKGKINFSVKNPDATAEFNIYVSGLVNVIADKSINLSTNEEININLLKIDGSSLGYLKYKAGVGFELLDEYSNQILTSNKKVSLKEGSSSNSVIITDTSIKFIDANATEAVLLGNKTHIMLNNIYQALLQINTILSAASLADVVVAGNIGLSGYVGVTTQLQSQVTPLLIQIANQLTTIKSTKVFTK